MDTADYREIMRRDAAARFADIGKTYEPPVIPPPLVPARPPRGAGEIAGTGGKQAVGLGRAVVQQGGQAEAAYWMGRDGSEGCAVRLAIGTMCAVATWKRPAGLQGSKTGWKADIAYLWPADRSKMPVKIGHTELAKGITRA